MGYAAVINLLASLISTAPSGYVHQAGGRGGKNYNHKTKGGGGTQGLRRAKASPDVFEVGVIQEPGCPPRTPLQEPERGPGGGRPPGLTVTEARRDSALRGRPR